jgi:hypothetical protein
MPCREGIGAPHGNSRLGPALSAARMPTIGVNRSNPATMPALSPLSSTSLSGMRVAQAALDASAHNIANLATPGLRRAGLAVSDSAAGGATAAPIQAAQARHAIETDMVDQLVAKNLFLANLAVFKTSDQLLGTLLDTHG